MAVIQFPNQDHLTQYERDCKKGANLAEAAIQSIRVTGDRPAFMAAIRSALEAGGGVKVGFLDRIAAVIEGY